MENKVRKTRAAVLHKPFVVKMEERELDSLHSNEVLIKVMSVGVCGSDVHYYEKGKIGSKKVEKPLIQGHECAGIVVEIGSEVTTLKIGDRVVIEPGISCGTCTDCKEGNYNLCSHVAFLSSPPIDGAFSEYIIHPENFLFKIPDNVTFEEATLIEPLSVGLHGLSRSGMKADSSVLISGMGPIGLTAIIAAKSFGALNIIATDIEPLRLKIAKELGATHVIDVSKQNLVESVQELTNDRGVDVVVETSGQEQAIKASVDIVKKGGNISVIGFSRLNNIGINFYKLLQKEVSIHGVYRYTNTYQHGVDILGSKKFKTDLLLTDFYPLEKVQEALEHARVNKSSSIKVIVKPND
ncbi:NAD(P)-dependent alcohol dehydrogenase [Oceanobacillus jeddahense]|uniref:NAD(P)-dependent alcohol dehydrogenase n=1 Tax=Oceanobacillus jeddahense TaxID=1462527 RepID=UPI0005962218|nr:NAD(P)-dependent alcohol dehydrogenase [Oceanobacillus jeddahense]